MRILITGGAGYVGAKAVPKLLVRGHSVRVVDAGYFGLGHLLRIIPRKEIIHEDIRRVLADAEFRDQILKDIDCVFHLAAISNDPSAELQSRTQSIMR